MTAPKYIRAAEFVRARIADGTLKAGSPAPTGAALARITGYSVLTCRRALGALVQAGVLVPGPSRNARLRVPRGPVPAGQDAAGAADDLSGALADRRRAAGLTQPELAALVGRSVTTVGHAETGRLWQSRRFWENADRVLCAGGELLRLHDAYDAAAAAPPIGDEARADDCPRDWRLPQGEGATGVEQEGRMPEQTQAQHAGQGRFHVDHSAVVAARMPDAGELASGYPAGVPVLVLTSHEGRKETVFASDRTELVFGDPEGVPDLAAVTAAADFVFGIIADDLDNAGGKLGALVRAAATSPGSVIRLAGEYRQERFMEMLCADTSRCEHAARAAAEFAVGVETGSVLAAARPRVSAR